jgi:hypothetical protein
MNIVDLASKKADNTDLLSAIDALRKAAEDGLIVAFVAVGIEPDLETRMWSGRTAGASIKRLHLMGAIAHLQACYHNDSGQEVPL